MSGRKEKYSVNMAGVSSLGRKERPAGSKSARRGGGMVSRDSIARKTARRSR